MAQGGYSFTLDEEESEDIDDSFMLPYMNPAVTFFKNRGDEKFRAKMYEEASVLYTAAMEQPVTTFVDISIISEKLFRKRAECFFKMGNYLDAIQDSERAIKVADNTNNPNLAKSVFIKMKAIIYLEDYPPAFPFALWCKHLRPNCEKSKTALNDLKEKLAEEFKKNEYVIDEVLFRVLTFAQEMRMDSDALELALECYTELLDLLDFLVLPKVQLRQAECLLQLGRCNEAKVACAKVLWLIDDDVDALSLMVKITGQISEREMRQVKEMEKLDDVKAEPPRIGMNDAAAQEPFQLKRQTAQREKESPLHVVPNVVQEKKEDLDQGQVEGVTAKEQGNNKRRKNGNREKKKKKKAKKKAQKKSESSLIDLPPASNDANRPSSQATDSVIGDPHLGSGYFLSSTLNVIEFDGYEVSHGEEFIPVPNTRRSPSSPSQGCQQMFLEKVSCLDWIGPSDENRQSSVPAASRQPNFETIEEMLPITDRQSSAYVRATSSTITSVTTANKKPSGLTSQTIVASQEQTTIASVASRNLVCDMSQRRSERKIFSYSEDFPTLERSSLQVSASSSDAVWSNLKTAHRPSDEPILVDVNSDKSLRIIPARSGNSSVSFTSPTPQQWQKITTPAPIIQSFQCGGLANTTNTHADQLIGLGNRVPIPEKVFVVCGHFLSQRPTCDYVQAKTCQWCEDRSLLNYAVWNDIYRYWQVIRPFPAGKIPPDAPLNVCRHFAAKTSCRREPCTYAHGEIERHLWEKQREGSLHTPNESLRLLRSINATAPTQLITQERDTDSLPLQTTVTITECVTMASFTTSLVNKCPGFDAVVTQSTITSLQPSTAIDVQSSKPSTFSHIRATTVIATPKAVPSGPIPYQGPNKDGVHIASPLFSCTTPIASSDPSLRPQFLPTSDMGIQEASSKGNTSSTGSLAEEKENPIAPIEAFVKPTDLMSKVKHEGTVLSDTLRAEVSNPSTWSSPLESNEIISTPVTSSAQTSTKTCEEIIQSSIPSQSPASEHSTNSQSSTWSNVLKAAGGPSTPIQKTNDIPSKNSPKDYRKVPTGVYVVCDHFLKENLRRAARVSPEAKPCKGCENRSKFKYAFWSVTWKQWEEIRPYPKDVNIKVAFKKCRQYSKHDRCLKIPCSFAHSELELTMWTMEREGILPTPRESFTGSFSSMPSASTQRSSAMQPTSQLRHRPSPPGITNGSYRLCRSCYTRERCRFGRGCIYAHNQHELNEWKKEYDRKIKEKLEKDIKEREELFSSEMASKILKAPQEDRVEYLAGVEVICSPPEFNVKLRDKEQYKWTFTLTFQPHEVGTLQNVFLLHRYHSFYHLSEIRVGCYEEKHGSETYKLCYTAKLKGPWYKSPSSARLVGRVEVVLKVSFESPLYGSFEQLVSFDFGRKPYLVKKLTADVTIESVTLPTAPEHLATHASAIWDERSVEVVRFVHETKEALQAEHLSRKHILPRQVEITDKVLSPKIYKNVMHQLLFAEERFMREEISRYTLSNTQLHAQRNIQDDMTGMKCAVNGELFGVFRLQEDALKPDDAAGRLLYRNVNSVWLQPANSESRTVYEASVEKVGSDCVVLRLPSKLCSELRLHDTCETAVNAQFQLNRWPLCQLHEAVERLTSGQLRLIFPDPTVGTVRREVKIRWQWLLDKRLNLNQKKVIERIASHEDNALPLVVFGPFGTGKTFTLNQTVRLLVQLDKSNRILLCTHSNRAADLHVELLHEYLTEKNGTPAARPLRVYQPMRRLETASTIARKYCLIEEGMFVLPRRDDVVERRVVITTLGTSRVLLDLEVLHGFFTHILIDEAAQALEPEALNPLKFAGTNTKIVFTGDHMQMSPEVYSPQARSLGLQKSLAERLFDLYEKYEAEASKGNPKLNEESNVLWLRENYRCNEHILKFPSENFYGKKLIARGHESQPAHPNYGPLLFFSARGKETKEQGNSYLNLSEVYEVEKRVKEISDNWPAVWGPKILSDIAVLSSYRYQVQAIRRSLRKEKDLRDVTVDTIHNVQGEEFRVLFISTVRTFHTCKPQQEELLNSGSDGQLYWEFLSDPKLLNTAVTRARCMIAVVGDPVSLCTMGECRGIWRDYIKRCYKAGGLHGTTMEELTLEIRASVASVQLNPIAKAFIPSFLPKIEKGLDAKAPEDKTIESTQDDVCVKVKVEKQNVGKVIETRSDSRGASGQQILNEGSAENDDLDGRDRPILNLKDQDRDQDEEEPDDDNADSNYFQECLLEDETVFPQDMDEIIQAFVRKCEETLKIDEERRSVFEDSEFPSLQAVRDLKQQPIEHVQRSGFKGGADIKDLFPEVRVINGRVEVRLTNLGFYSSPSERAKRVMISSRQQDFLDPSVLMKLIADEPEKYIVCNLRLSPEKLHVGYAEVEDTKTPSIQIKGKLRQAFDRDKVVVEIGERKAHSKTDENEPAVQGRVVGVLEHIISPHERQFVCTTDYESPAVMVPINKAATKLVNLTDKSCKNIPVYKKDQYGRAIKVRMLKREKVLNGKYLFVVKYLQWRRDFSNPLGIVVRALSKGEDLKSSMEIAYAEHGVRRKFKEQTLKYVGENFPPGWSIPKAELNNRTRVSEAITIDPPSSLDLDDALTIEDISSSTFLVGIHIADVSFFVRPNTPIDDEAFARCTSYYPGHGHENVPMLPRPLSENFCSLLPNEDRLAVSVFVTLDEEGKQIGDPQIKRTIVRSCCRLNYVEAQMIIDKIDESTLEIPEGIKRKVRQLSSLAQKRRIHRLGDGAFDHWQNGGNDFEAHELVEEWMILANEEIAKLLSHRNSELALLRIQLPPKDHRLAEWIKMYGKYTRMSLTLSATFTEDTTNTTSFVALHDESIKFKIQKQVWRAICQAAESNDFPSLQYLICNESNYPQIATAVSHFRRLQAESRCVCEGDQSPENIYHYSLRIPRYTRFTSPIRRYIDIVVHRLLIGLVLTSSSCNTVNLPSKDEVLKVCRRYTFMQDNARKFEKYCKKIHMANQLQQRCRETRVFVESIQHQSICLQISNKEDDLLSSKDKRIALSHLNLLTVDEKEEIQGKEQSIVLKWKIRKYVAPDYKGETPELSSAKHRGIDEVIEIPPDIWVSVLNMVRAKDEDKLISTIKEAKEKLSTMPSNREKDTSTETNSSDQVRGIYYQHPHQNDKAQPSFEGMVDHFYEKKVMLRKYDFLSVQLCPHMIRGILQPNVQIVKVDNHLNVCIEHRKYPRETFSRTTRHQASRERYESIEEYIQTWEPVLSMEAATQAVRENDGFTIENLNVAWKRKAENARGVFKLPLSYCDSRQLDFHNGDLVCIRMSYCETSPPSGESENGVKSSKDNLHHSNTDRTVSDFWVAHCIIKNVNVLKKKSEIKVKMDLHQSASNIPEGLSNEQSYRCTLELIHRTLPQRRMYAALCSLEHSSEVVHAICRGDEPSKENYGELPTSFFLTQYGFKRLNAYQKTAVKQALCNPFTLIQGPPGTGKTVTGVHIAYWFAEQNKTKSCKLLEKETSETENDGAHKSPPQVIYCGPSNKSVDVVTELLLKIPDLKVLRVYSDQVEQKEFPIPNKLKPARTTRSDDEMKISSDQIRSVSLHHVIRDPKCPYSEELRKYEEGFAHCKEMNETIGQKEVTDYCKTIGLAEKWALQESRVQIILCTCVASGSPRIVSSCDNIQQCIVDECGMCMEPESLVPITCSRAKQVVLIGDHKQLQPVIQDHVAKTLGLSVSMFERHSKRAMMLELQYRMHDGICEFPSRQFYDGKLRTADEVKSRAPSPVSFWPAQVRRQRKLPIVFCHVEGQEESAAIATSESNEESKRNMKEVHKAVQVAKHLVNRYVSHVRRSDVVILSPYREQRSKITELLKGAYEDIKVTTITKSQGSEWDYVIISLVRSVKRDEIDLEPSLSWLRNHLGFLTDEHQMNVGLTRARRGLCIIGNKYLLELDPAWRSLLEHYEDNGCLVNEDWPWP